MTGAAESKHAGSRRGPRRKARFQPVLLLLALGVTACIVAWGYLVWAAIDFGQTARGGDRQAWWFLGLASLGAVACLFIGLMLIAAITRRLGITKAPAAKEKKDENDDEPRPIGGRRASR